MYIIRSVLLYIGQQAPKCMLMALIYIVTLNGEQRFLRLSGLFLFVPVLRKQIVRVGPSRSPKGILETDEDGVACNPKEPTT
jgi:hypothetical protein